jgi:putative transferase (TIGR04331 family)
MGASKFSKYIKELILFKNNLSDSVINLMKFRLFNPHISRGWDIKSQLLDSGGLRERNIDNSGGSIYNKINRSRLCVSTANSTTFLETFSSNFPTLIFWNPKHWELRPEAQPYYDELHKVGILHYTPESAAEKLNDIFEDPQLWWNQKEIQAVKNKFSKNFASVEKHWIKEWKNEIKSVNRTNLINELQ